MAKKIYAVKRGRSTGLFTSWDACKKQVEGFDGARFKGFMSARDALAWLNDTEDTQYIKKTSVSRVEKSASAPSDADYIIYTDGSCLKNPMGPGGWACVIRETATGKITELAEGSPATTNNRMEMRAAIAALSFPKQPSKIALFTDSQYLKNGMTKWIYSWKKRGWKKADGTEVLNRDLWIELDRLYNEHKVSFHWVKGHIGVSENERCDELAKKEAMKY